VALAQSESSIAIKDDRLELAALLYDQVGVQKIIDRLSAMKALLPEKAPVLQAKNDEAANWGGLNKQWDELKVQPIRWSDIGAMPSTSTVVSWNIVSMIWAAGPPSKIGLPGITGLPGMTGLPGIEMCSIALSMPGGTENEGWGIYFSKVQVNSPS
jgi:hypothetical protein